jgi:O-antigen/teichoic acid export membrane protein
MERPTKRQAAAGIGYSALGKASVLGVRTITSLVVARTLSPADMGLVGFANMVVGFLGRFNDIGLTAAVVRSPRQDTRILSTALTLKVSLGIGLVGIAMLGAGSFGSLVGTVEVSPLVRVLSLSFLLTIIGFVATVSLTRDLDFGSLAMVAVAGALARGTLVLVLLARGWRYWALVAADLVGTAVSAFVASRRRRVKLSLEFDRRIARELLAIALPLFGSGLLSFVALNLDSFLIGSRLGMRSLGLYAIAVSWSTFVCLILQETVNAVMLPALSRMQSDIGSMREWYLKTIEGVGLAATAVNGTMAGVSAEFLRVVLGHGTDKWLPARSALEVLCVYGAIRALTEPIYSVIVALGRTRVLLYSNALAAAVELGLLLILLPMGRLDIVAYAITVAYTLQWAWFMPLLARELRVSWRDLVRVVWPMMVSGGMGMAIARLSWERVGGGLIVLCGRGAATAIVIVVVHCACTRCRLLKEGVGLLRRGATGERGRGVEAGK